MGPIIIPTNSPDSIELHQALIWLIVIEVVGVITLPMTYRLLGSLPDRGIIFSKAIGLLLAAYLFWALGLSGALPNVQWAAVVVVAALAVPSAIVLRTNGPEILAFLKRERTAIIAAELVFLAFFLVWVALASFAPGYQPHRAAHGLWLSQLYSQERELSA